jgi:hypothetical protein
MCSTSIGQPASIIHSVRGISIILFYPAGITFEQRDSFYYDYTENFASTLIHSPQPRLTSIRNTSASCTMTPRQITLNWLELNLWSKIPEAAYSQIPLLLSVRDLLHKIEAGKLKSVRTSSTFLSTETAACKADYASYPQIH